MPCHVGYNHSNPLTWCLDVIASKPYIHMLLSNVCCDKVPQTGWLKNYPNWVTYSLIVLEARSLRSSFWQGQMPAEGTKKLLLALSAGMSFWCSLACDVNTPIFASLFISPSPLHLSQVCVKFLSTYIGILTTA